MSTVSILIDAKNNTKRPLSEVSSDLDRIEGKRFSGVTSSLSNIGKAAGLAAVGGIAALGAGLGVIVAGGVRDASALQAQMSGIQAVMMATGEETGELKSLIMDLSVDQNLKVSAQEAAAAVEMLARNGLNVDEVMGGAARGVVEMSNATGSDFATAANIATDAMALWNIEAENLSQAADGITSVLTSSKFDINDYALALSQGGGVAAAVGVEFDDFNAAISAMAPLFGSGADAGTSFKVMLQRMVPQTNAAADAMVGIGLAGIDAEKATDLLNKQLDQMKLDGNTEEVKKLSEEWLNSGNTLETLRKSLGLTQAQFLDYQIDTGILSTAFHNLDGSMKSMPEIVGALNSSLSGLSDQQKQSALSTIFGTDAMRAAAGLADLTETEFRELQATMGQTSAADAAATRINNLAGDVEIFKSVLGGLKIQLGDALLPALRSMTQWATGALGYIPPLVANFQNFFTTVGEGQGVFAPLVNLVGNVMRTFGASNAEILKVKITLIQLGEQIGAFISTAQTALAPITNWIGENIKLRDILIPLAALIGTGIVVALGSLIATIAPFVAAFAAVAVASSLLRQAWETNFIGIRDFSASTWVMITSVFSAFKLLFQGDFTGFALGLLEAWKLHIKGIADFVGNLWGLIRPKLILMKAAFFNLWNGIDWEELGYNVVTWILGTLMDMGRWAGELATWASNVFAGASNSFAGIDWGSIPRNIIAGMVNVIKNSTAVKDALTGMATGAWNAVRDFFQERSPSRLAMKTANNLIAGMVLPIQNDNLLPRLMVDWASGAWQGAANAIGQTLPTPNLSNLPQSGSVVGGIVPAQTGGATRTPAKIEIIINQTIDGRGDIPAQIATSASQIGEELRSVLASMGVSE